MSTVRIPWAPRVILTGRVFRLPVQGPETGITLMADGFERISDRFMARDSARYYYLQAPKKPGDFVIKAHLKDQVAETTVQVRTLDMLRQPHAFNGAQWPRRWPVGETFTTSKARQTLQDVPVGSGNASTSAWWVSQPDAVIWKQLPVAEIPRAHFVNAHQGSPTVGTAVFKHSGFYPWKRNHLPIDFKSICPESGDVFPSNDLAGGDYISGEYVDDGYGYFDAEGHIFLFAATYARDQVRSFGAGIGIVTQALRAKWDDETARKLGLMLLRYAAEECYVASVPQFRYGPSKGVEEPWDWGQPDWAVMDDPVAAIGRYRIGSMRYSIDTPYIAETLALAYDTLWPFLKTDQALADRAQAQGLNMQKPGDVVQLIEEMLACLLQCILDRAAGSNLPRESQGALALLRVLDRPDAQTVMDWLYDDGPDTLRVFTVNDFFPDGTPPEATGGYNSIHTDGVFDLEYHLRKFRNQHPQAYPESQYPSLMSDPRAAHVVRATHEIAMGGKTFFQFGDGSAPGSGSSGRAAIPGSIELVDDCFYASMAKETLDHGVAFTQDAMIKEIREAVKTGRHRKIGSTVLDGVGIAVLRTPEAPERAAVGIVYGDTTGHRHRDLLDVQLIAFGRPFLTDLGYPQSWASIAPWEAHWATHNTVWGITKGDDARVAGRGRLVRTLFVDGVQLLEVEAHRWVWDGKVWTKSDVRYRRLIALVETDGMGVAIVDLSRIGGGVEHWRMCRGLEGDFYSDVKLEKREGTVAGVDVHRGQVDRLPHSDYAALAYMDDVAAGHAPAVWHGRWQSRFEPQVCLDLHQAHVSAGTELLTARATAMMGTPEESNYNFRTLLWRRKPQSDETSVNLVFEPHLGNPTLSDVVWEGNEAAAAVRLKTKAGRDIAIYWAPEGETTFANGVKLGGGIGVVIDGKQMAVGATHFADLKVDHARISRSVLALDRDACTVDVDGIDGIKPGDRVVINPERGHTYRVEEVKPIDKGRVRLKLDVTSLLGRSSIETLTGDEAVLRYLILARTGNLHGTHLVGESHQAQAAIVSAHNPGREKTAVRLNNMSGGTFKVGDWVRVVDYVVGDTLIFEPLCVR